MTGYLTDTNILIYYVNGEGSAVTRKRIEGIIHHSFIISVISQMEFLGFRGYSDADFKLAKNFIQNASVYNISPEIVEKTIEIRRKYSIKLPDAIIAATALCHDLVLITHNRSDFDAISNISIIDPCNE